MKILERIERICGKRPDYQKHGIEIVIDCAQLVTKEAPVASTVADKLAAALTQEGKSVKARSGKLYFFED